MAALPRAGDVRRMRRTREIWADIIRQWEESGLTAEEFGAKRGIAGKTLSWWKWKLRQSVADLPSLVPVRVIASGAPLARCSTDGDVEVELSDGVRLRFGREVTSEFVVEIVSRLRQC